MTITEAKRQRRMAEWARKIRDQQASGLSVHAWCAAHGCGEGRYYYWLKIVRAEVIKQAAESAQGAALVRVEPERLLSPSTEQAIDGATEQPGITMTYGKASVVFPTWTPLSAIAEVLKALARHD